MVISRKRLSSRELSLITAGSSIKTEKRKKSLDFDKGCQRIALLLRSAVCYNKPSEIGSSDKERHVLDKSIELRESHELFIYKR